MILINIPVTNRIANPICQRPPIRLYINRDGNRYAAIPIDVPKTKGFFAALKIRDTISAICKA